MTIEKTGDCAWRLMEGDREAGRAAFASPEWGILDLTFAVAEEYWGRGLVQKLLDAALAWALAHRYGGIVATVPRLDYRAIAVCERNGFACLAARPEAFVYWRRLPVGSGGAGDNPAVDYGAIAVRPFQPDDEPLVEEFFAQMGGESRAFFNRGDGNHGVARGYFSGRTAGFVHWMATMDEGRKMAGYVFLIGVDTGVPTLGIALREECKGRRLGQILIEHARRYARAAGCGGLQLTVSPANPRGQKLYERCGFVRQGDQLNELAYLLPFPRNI